MNMPVGNHGLSCIEDTDYAAFALSMKCNAEAIDAALQFSNGTIGGFQQRGWISVTNTAGFVVDDSSGGGAVGPGGIVGAFMDTNGSGSGSPSVIRSALPGPFPSSGPMPAGIYLVGSSINYTFGALTANSLRQLRVYGVKFLNGNQSAISNSVNIYAMRDYQGDGGATGALTTVGVVDGRDGNIAHFASFVNHANTASDMTVAAPDWRLWVTFLGSGLDF